MTACGKRDLGLARLPTGVPGVQGTLVEITGRQLATHLALQVKVHVDSVPVALSNGSDFLFIIFFFSRKVQSVLVACNGMLVRPVSGSQAITLTLDNLGLSIRILIYEVKSVLDVVMGIR